MPPIDSYFTSTEKAHRNRRHRKYTEEEASECRALLNLPGKERMTAYNAAKQSLYKRHPISTALQLFVDKIDKAIVRTSRRWGKSDVLDEEISRIKI